MQTQIQRELVYLGEPSLEFRYSQKVLDPKAGLSIFGPYGSDQPSHPKSISYGVVGTKTGVELTGKFIEKIRNSIVSDLFSDNPRLWPVFPGFQAAFNSSLSETPTRTHEVDETQLLTFASNYDPNKRAFDVTNLYLEGIKHITNPDDPLRVILCPVPDVVYQNCRPKSFVRDGVGDKVSFEVRKERAAGQVDLFRTLDPSRSFDPKMYRYSVDFRRQIKARSMKYDVPIQIIKESTLETKESQNKFESSGKSPLSDRAWNICTTLFYKAGGKLWRLSTAREGVCYVGIVYRRTDPVIGEKTACCAAQMFLDTGDGVVIRGDYGPWFSEEKKEFHLTREAAHNLLFKVLNTYQELEGKPLMEVFLHYRVWINEEEYEGFKSACPDGVKLTCIRVSQEDNEARLYREGTRPILRGTLLKINDKRAYLFASGFKPFLGTYDGWETPVPLRIDVQYGDESITQVAKDILGLTKLNYNACKYGDANPVTIEFSNAVGEILVSNPELKDPNPKFKYYI